MYLERYRNWKGATAENLRAEDPLDPIPAEREAEYHAARLEVQVQRTGGLAEIQQEEEQIEDSEGPG